MTKPTAIDSVSAPAPARGRGAWLKLAAGLAFVLAGAVYLAIHRAAVFAALGEIGWWPVLASLPLALAGATAAMLAWRAILADLGHPLASRPAGRIYFASQLGKYLPGSVWTVVAQMELGRRHRVPRPVSFAAGLLALALSVAVGTAVAATLLPFGAAGALRRFWWLLLVAPAILATLHPRVIVGSVNLALRALRRPPMAVRPSGRGLARATGWQLLAWLLLGLHCYLLVLGFGPDRLRSLPLAAGGLALAYCVGVLFVPAPAGVGVRELALAVALGAVLAAPQAAVVVVVSRFVLAVGDGLLAGTWWLASTREERP